MTSGFCAYGSAANPGTEEISYHESPHDHSSASAHYVLDPIRPNKIYGQVSQAVHCNMDVSLGMSMGRTKHHSGFSRTLLHARRCFINREDSMALI